MFGYAAIGYLFLGGLGAAAFFLPACAFLVDAVHPTPRTAAAAEYLQRGFYVAPVALAAGILLLSLEVGNFDRVWRLALHPFASVMSVGAWMLMLTLVVSCLFLLVQTASHKQRPILTAGFYVVGSVLALGTMLYTGLLLSSTLAFDFWRTPLLPALFVASSLSCGYAACLAAAVFAGAFPHGVRFHTTEMVTFTVGNAFTVVELVLLALFLTERLVAGGTAAESVLSVLFGAQAGIFWIVIIGGGMAFPLVVRAVAHDPDGYRSGIVLAVTLASLVSGWALRYVIVTAGIWAPMVL